MSQFEFEAQNPAGQPIRGSLEAPSADAAAGQLRSLGVNILSLRPLAAVAQRVSLGAVDVEQFNEQLLHVASANLPLERGLDLLAKDMRRGRLRNAVEALSADLRSGQSLEQAVASRQAQFPAIYSKLLDAGVKSGDLVGVLHGFGRHLATVARLRQELWRACAYPLVVLVAFGLLMIFLSYWVLPQYFALVASLVYGSYDFGRLFRGTSALPRTVEIPPLAIAMYWFGRAMPYLLGGLAVAGTATGVAWLLLRSVGRERRWVDAVILRLPLVGGAIRHSYVARWTNALAIAVRSGLDLPRAIDLASQVVALPSFERDGQAMIETLEQGRTLDACPPLKRLPASLPPAIALASSAGNLPQVLSALAVQYEQHADRRTRLIPATIVPALVVLIGLTAGAIVYSLWVPMVRLLQSLTF